jgi:hypothetical protein
MTASEVIRHFNLEWERELALVNPLAGLPRLPAQQSLTRWPVRSPAISLSFSCGGGPPWQQGPEKASVAQTIYRIYRRDIVMTALIMLTWLVFFLLTPLFFMRELIGFSAPSSDKTVGYGIFLALGMMFSEALRSLFAHQYWCVWWILSTRFPDGPGHGLLRAAQADGVHNRYQLAHPHVRHRLPKGHSPARPQRVHGRGAHQPQLQRWAAPLWCGLRTSMLLLSMLLPLLGY